MDKIFKQKFKNFEKKAPDHVLEQLLKEVNAIEASSSIAYKKIALWSFAVIAVATSIFFFIPEENKAVLSPMADLQKTAISAQEGANVPLEVNLPKETKTKTITKDGVAQTSVIEIVNNNSDNKSDLININNPEKATIVNIEEDKVNESKSITILAPRYSCTGECILEINEAVEGHWSANRNVIIASADNTTTSVSYTDQGRVLFTFMHDNQKDTFTVFFKKPANTIDYQVTNEFCGEKNGKIEFIFPINRSFSSTNNYTLIESTIKSLTVNNHTVELVDNYSCQYQYNIEINSEELEASILHDQLDNRVDYPIYFTIDKDLNDADFIWDFGDGEVSYDRKPEHIYKKPGLYNIQLQIIKDNCAATVYLNELAIKDKELEIPNIFTPNNDGKNDIFLVSVPQNVKSFEGYILNKSGQLVYKWTDGSKGWDGYLAQGDEALQGSYYYVIKGIDSTNKVFEYKSCFELKR